MPSDSEAARPARADDVDLLITIAEEHAKAIADDRGAGLLFRRELLLDDLATELRAAIDDSDASVIVGLFDGYPFGYALVYYERLADGAWLARLEHLVVDASARKVGVGEAIMNRVLDEARARSCIGIDSRALPGDRDTKNFFESFGLKARLLTVHRSLDSGHDGR